MAKSPREPRDPAKHSKKDPAKPTRAKASRPDMPPLEPSLAELLNPAIGRGRAGVGSQTGIVQENRPAGSRKTSVPSPQDSVPSPLVGEGQGGGSGGGAQTSIAGASPPDPHPQPLPARGRGSNKGLQPPPDNSFDRRADFSAAHRARKSTQCSGFDEAPQRGYVARTPVDINAELRKSLGYGESDPTKTLIGQMPEERDEISDISEPRREKRHRPTPQPITLGVTASMQALEKLLREGRAEFSEQDGAGKVWTPHRPPRPEKSEGGQQLVIKSDFEPKGDQPTAITRTGRGRAGATTATRCCSASPARARPSPWRR